MLAPAGPFAALLTPFLWATFAIAGTVTAIVFVLLGVAVARRGTPGRLAARVERRATIAVGAAGAITAVILIAYFTTSLVISARVAAAPQSPLEVQVFAHEWWWEFRVTGTSAVTANELHIPVGRPVRLTLRSVDVIHSFWVPQLAHKADVFPHEDRTLVIEADHAGRYDGVCAEYCGAQHAWMRLVVVADAAGDYQRWVDAQAAERDAAAASSAGERIFTSSVCASCHTIRGTSAAGTTGPDLTHVASRGTLGAGVLPNTRDEILAWISDPQRYKPSSWMPKVDLSRSDLTAIADYLASLH